MSTERPLGLSAHIFVRDPEAAVTFYTAAFGATEVFRNTNGVIRDPFGHRWALCTRREEFTPGDIERETPSRIPPEPA